MLSNSDNLPALQTEDFLPPLGIWVKFGGLFILSTVAAAVAVSAVAPYPVIVKAPAAIRPVGELRLVQAATTGIVMQMQVIENQTVQQGDVIAKIDDSQLQTKKAQLQNSIQQSQRQILQVQSQVKAMDSQISAEATRRRRAVAAAAAGRERYLREYQDQQVISTTEVESATASLRAAQAALTAAQVRLQRYQPVAAAGALDRDRLEEAELAAQQQSQEVIAAQARLARAKAGLNPTQAAVAVASEQIAQEQATGAATLAALDKEREALIQQQIQIQNQLALDRQELAQIKLELGKTTVTAPASGIIAKLTLRNPGQTVQPGQEIAQIVPSQTQLSIKALVEAQDISKVNVGQSAQLRISACPYPDYGTLSGTVKAIAPDATPPSRSETPALPYYEVTLEPERLMLSRGERRCQVQVGMEGKIDIISRKDTVLRSILRKARLISAL
ncbi:MAG: HlyD family efflux transporter periplasmic adaptor subunit [Pegethrix bostrychoides GSE-TBD4-15B]|uniref:HlyD family efflux transporter periplasmic adaptor subunit n=1 Tax=Pegethrix bostrychoides GSE-TBD4-15B TaxID=2839662 RepID=A0A951U3E5_9CYAN|nr:HlyD family efflux transporter periplasmic adaptor subunit [Pegethrix bostrychoides GSE-TBD4-15B]